MTHRVELALHQYMEDASNGKSSMSDETIGKICDDIKEALQRQFGSKTKNDKFSLRMSNLGRPTCQLWFLKNKPDTATSKPSNFIMNMMIGDIVEAIFKGLLSLHQIGHTEINLNPMMHLAVGIHLAT